VTTVFRFVTISISGGTKAMNVTLSPEIQVLVRQKIESGDFSNEQEVIETAVRRMDEADRRRWLEGAIAKGLADLDRGDTVEWTPGRREEAMQKAIKRAQLGERPSPDVLP
jgi:antitoxin ParD1/3/4